MRGVSGVHFDAALWSRSHSCFGAKSGARRRPTRSRSAASRCSRSGRCRRPCSPSWGTWRARTWSRVRPSPERPRAGHLADATEWLGSRGVDFCVAVAEGRPGSDEAEDWLNRSRYEQEGDWRTFVRDAAPSELPAMPGIEILELGEGEGEGMSGIAAEGLGLPEWAGTLRSICRAARAGAARRPLGRRAAACGATMVEGEFAGCSASMPLRPAPPCARAPACLPRKPTRQSLGLRRQGHPAGVKVEVARGEVGHGCAGDQCSDPTTWAVGAPPRPGSTL